LIVRKLPSGTVTFLFTDVEGRRGLLQELGDGYPDVLAEHRHVLREASARHGGVEVGRRNSDQQGVRMALSFRRCCSGWAGCSARRATGRGATRSVEQALSVAEEVGDTWAAARAGAALALLD
jgi:hypothetical protein